MKSTLLSHKGYHGSIEPSVRDGKLKGHILFIDDMITYSAPTIPDLQKAFVVTVNDYLEDCGRTGKFPQRPFKGQFNVRIAPQLHQTAVLHAETEGTSLNNVVVRALRSYLHKEPEKDTLTEDAVSSDVLTAEDRIDRRSDNPSSPLTARRPTQYEAA